VAKRIKSSMDLSIIIVNYNTKDLLINCVESIVKHTKDLKYEIVIVDNNSKDIVKRSWFKDLNSKLNLKIVLNKENKGFGTANNSGLNKSEGEYILFLNSDTLIHDNVFFEMVQWIKANKNVGVVSCALKNADGSLEGSGGYFPTLSKVFAWMFFLEDIPFLDTLIKPFHPVHGQSFIYSGTKQFEKKRKQDWVTGAFMLIPEKVLNKVGAFDEDYFMYTEEVDLCFRIKKAGYLIWYLPEWWITHLGSASSTKEFPLLQEYKSMKLFYKKHMPEWQMPVLRTFLKLGALLRIPIFGLLKGKEVSKIYAKAFTIA
jgi:GT2 family glycosyltransferase